MKEDSTIKAIVSNNGFNPKIIERLIQNKQKKGILKEIFPDTKDVKNKIWKNFFS